MLFEITDTVDPFRERAKNLLLSANQTAETLLSLFKAGRESVFGIDKYTIADCQQLLDTLDAIQPGTTARLFQLHGALGQFLAQVAPKEVTEEMLKAPVAYTVDMTPGYPRIVLDKDAKYPTEKAE